MEKIGTSGQKIISSIPFVGTAIAGLDEIIGTLWTSYKEMSLNARINAINLITVEKLWLKELNELKKYL